jgi:hypothetical protein
VALLLDPALRPAFGMTPSRQGEYEVWSAVMTADAVKSLFAMPRVQMAENTAMDGKATEAATVEFDTSGLKVAWALFSAACTRPATGSSMRGNSVRAITFWPGPTFAAPTPAEPNAPSGK